MQAKNLVTNKMSEEIIKLQLRKVKLLQAIEETKKKKEKIIIIVQNLVKELNSGKITRDEYEEKLNFSLKKRSGEQWIKYYDDYINYYDYQIKLCDKLINEAKKKEKSEKKKGVKEEKKEKITIYRGWEDKKRKRKLAPILSILIGIVLIAIFISVFVNLQTAGINVFSKISEKVSTTISQLIEQASEAPVITLVSEFVEPTLSVSLEDTGVLITEESLTQYQAVVGEPVKWKKQFTTDSITGFSVELPKGSENVKVKKIKEGIEENITESAEIGEKLFGKKIEVKINKNSIISQDPQENTEPISFEIIYETPAPEKSEEIVGKILSSRKRITINGPDDVHYKNILSFTDLPKELTEQELGKFKLYQIKDNQRIETQFIAYDTNENGLYDYIRWITPELSGDVFEWTMIKLTKAEHLDENKIFINYIYEEVKELDGVWSETISDEHYVRIKFEKMLNRDNDITIYLRVVSGNPRIEVYENNGTEKIAEFSSLNEYEYNKILLTNLSDGYYQDVFDLRVVDGSVEFDWIVDPIRKLYTITDGTTVFNDVVIIGNLEWNIDFWNLGTSASLSVSGTSINLVPADAGWAHLTGTQDCGTGPRTLVSGWLHDTPCSYQEIYYPIHVYKSSSIKQIVGAGTYTFSMGTSGGGVTNSILGTLTGYGCDPSGVTGIFCYTHRSSSPATQCYWNSPPPEYYWADIHQCFTSTNICDMFDTTYGKYCNGARTTIQFYDGTTAKPGVLFDSSAWTSGSGTRNTYTAYSQTWVTDDSPASISFSKPITITLKCADECDEGTKGCVANTPWTCLGGSATTCWTKTNAADCPGGTICVSGDCIATNQAPSIHSWTVDQGTPGSCVNDVIDYSGNNFRIVLADPDGWADLQDANVYVNFTKAGQTRPATPYKCVYSGNNGVSLAFFNCEIIMNYWDLPGSDWLIRVAANDGDPINGRAAQQTSQATNLTSYPYFTYQSSTDIIFQESPYSGTPDKTIDWANVMTTSAELQASNHLNLTNCGNWNLTSMTLTAKNLTGSIYSGNFDAKSFSVAANTLPTVVDPCTNDTKSNLTTLNSVTITAGATLPLGAYSINAPKTLSFCINDVNPADPTPITVDTYRSTTNPWDIAFSFTISLIKFIKFNFEFSILLSIVIVRVKRKKKKLKKKLKTKNKLLSHKELLNLDLILKKKYDISVEGLLREAKEKEIREKFEIKSKIEIPLSIFNKKLSPAEVLCKYLKENKKMKFSEIAKLINRDERSIWANYNNAVKKIKEKIKDEKRADKIILISINLFADRRLSILESVVKYLREKGFRNCEIAELLGKDQRNIYTIYSRVKRKLE